MSAVKFKTFDVRPMLAQGVEPYSEIRRRVDGAWAAFFWRDNPA